MKVVLPDDKHWSPEGQRILAQTTPKLLSAPTIAAYWRSDHLYVAQCRQTSLVRQFVIAVLRRQLFRMASSVGPVARQITREEKSA
jgi:hypothetical protein